MESFRQVLDECNLLDLGYMGNKFTWSKSFPNGGMVWERLDRAVSTVEWLDLFPVTKVQTLSCVTSDHSPILILPDGFGANLNWSGLFSNKPWKKWDFTHDGLAGFWSVLDRSPIRC